MMAVTHNPLILDRIIADAYFQYHDPYTTKPMRNKYCVVKTAQGDRVEEVREVTVFSFILDGGIEDPEIMAAEPLYDWEHSEHGQWVMRNACDTPTWVKSLDPSSYNYKFIIRAKFMGPALTEMLLRYGDK
jgi:hypothetical protein